MHKENREMKLIKKIMTNITAHRERGRYIYIRKHTSKNDNKTEMQIHPFPTLTIYQIWVDGLQVLNHTLHLLQKGLRPNVSR